MFRNRQSSQKPPDELFERFRQSFPGVRGGSTSAPNDSQTQTAGLDGSIINQPSNRFGHEHEDLDPTPKPPSEPFRFTPSLLDPNSSAFAAFANQPPPGLFTPTPGGGNSLYNSHSHHDLQTPNVGISIGTPLSLPNNSTVISRPTAGDMHDYNSQTIQPHQFQNYQPFSQSLHPGYLDPSHYHNRPPSGPGSPMDVGDGVDIMGGPGPLDGPPLGAGALMSLEGKQYDHELAPHSSTERFRFHVVLNAPTAMIKHPDEIPVTYLNKGQAYAISIVDTSPPGPSTGPIRYRTYIRISFHDETQRSRPAACWQLWKEGRGTNEAHQRGGKLQAVEYVDPSSTTEDDKKKSRVDIEAASFDSFVVNWSPDPNGAAETSVSVRFNFLSTDFSHSKGVKGIPVRLCAKTEVLSSGSPQSPQERPEICFCKVKLFRDHGAERKLANDILHVKKTIEKLRQQANQVEGTGMKIFGKKNKKEEEIVNRPGKVPKHKRTWSMSSASSVGGGRSQEEDTNGKLASLQDMFTSTRAVSILYLKGSDPDDPDLHPVYLPGEVPGLADDDIWARRRSSVATTNTTTSSFVSPTPSSASLSSQHGEGFNSPERREWERGFQPLPPPQHQHMGIPDAPVRVQKMNNDASAGLLSGWIEAIGIDSTYIPPLEKPSKAVMSVYILPVVMGSPQINQFYRAVYLQSRTASSLTDSIAAKCGIDPATVLRTVHMSNRGLSIFVDDEFVREMAEGQDMKVQAVEIREESPFASPPREWCNSPETSQTDSEGNKNTTVSHGWELRLLY